jgi:hypothetical protein
MDQELQPDEEQDQAGSKDVEQDAPSLARTAGQRPEVITHEGFRAAKKVFYYGRAYTVEKQRNNMMYLKCSVKKCAGRAKKRETGQRIELTRDHTACEPDFHAHLVEEARYECLQLLESSLSSPKNIYDSVMKKYSPKVSAKWPFSTAKSFLVANRKKFVPTLPKSLGELLSNLQAGVYPSGIQSLYIGNVTMTRTGKCISVLAMP